MKGLRKVGVMDADGVPIVGQSLDLKLLEPLQHKRTLAYINHFIIQVNVMTNLLAQTHSFYTIFCILLCFVLPDDMSSDKTQKYKKLLSTKNCCLPFTNVTYVSNKD